MLKPVGVVALGLWGATGRGHGLAGKLQILYLAEVPGMARQRG